MEKQSIIIIGHGSKSAEAIEDFNFIVDSTRKKTEDYEVYGAHMEIAKPSLEEVVAELSTAHARKIVVVPYFLFNGNHIKFDIPAKIKNLKEQYPHLEFKLGSPIGKEALMAEIMLKKALDTDI